MLKPNRLATTLVIAILLSLANGPFFIVSAAPLAAVSPTLGNAANYSVLAGATVTNTGPTTMPGSLGVSPGIGTPHITGFPPGLVGPPGTIHDADSDAATAQSANTAAFGALIAAPNDFCTTTFPGVKDLTGLTLPPGVYCADSFLLSGTLTLSDTDAANVWIFRSDLSTLVTTPGVNASVVFLNGVGSPCNVWWRVASSATLGSGTAFIGNILALTSISMGAGASLNGRALTQTGSVTLDSDIFTGGTCLPAATATPTGTATATSTQTSTSTGTATSTATPTVTSTGVPTATPSRTPTTVPSATHPAPAPQNTAVPTATETPLPAPTATAPAVVGLPATGGGPLPGPAFPWAPALVAGSLGLLALGLGVRGYRRRGRGLVR